MKILLLGSGGREHVLAWKMAQSNLCDKLYIAPGNAGTASCGKNVSIKETDFESIEKFVSEKNINMVMVGTEAPLVSGIYDYFLNKKSLKNVQVIGPSKKGAMLEGSKQFAKEFMRKNKIPTARYTVVTQQNLTEGIRFIDSLSEPIVLKADGLAAGKGVLICSNKTGAIKDLKEMLDGKFGEASKNVVIEEFLTGIELTIFIITDGISYKILPSSKDYKRIGENDTGLNTGGMGAVSPVPFADETFMRKVEEKIIKPTINGLQDEGIIYKGFIYFGLMNVKDNPFVIEYNVRLGDPEAQVVIPRIKSDLVDLFLAVSDNKLSNKNIEIEPKAAAAIVLASSGYPGDYEKGKEIHGLEKLNNNLVFHAGTSRNANGKIVTNGGRVLAVASFGNNIKDAVKTCIKNAETIDYAGKYYRKDIGLDVCKKTKL